MLFRSEIPEDHWYHSPGEGGRVLGNLCHWIDFTYQMMPPHLRFPITIRPILDASGNNDMCVIFTYGDGSTSMITFFATSGHAFEGVRERYSAYRGHALIAMDDFERLIIDVEERKRVMRSFRRDHGHENSICRSYRTSRSAELAGYTTAEIRETGTLFLRTKDALESRREITIEGNAL